MREEKAKDSIRAMPSKKNLYLHKYEKHYKYIT